MTRVPSSFLSAVATIALTACSPTGAPSMPASNDAAPPGTTSPTSSPSATVADAGKAPGMGAVRYLALGDSFTAGTGSSAADAFPVRLTARLGERGAQVTLENLGVNGYTTDDLLRDELPRVATFHPTLVTLAIGANDLVHGSSLERYTSQVRRILRDILAAGVAPSRVLVIPQPDWSSSPVAAGFGEPRAIRSSIDAFNAALAREAKAASVRFVDLGPRMRAQADAHEVARDGLHPSARAYDAWAEDLFPIVMSELTGP